MRNDHKNATCNCRAMAISNDGGSSFGPITYDAALISPVCQASVLSDGDGDNHAVFFANPASIDGRYNGVVRRSADGLHWDAQLSVSGPAPARFAYSCLTKMPGGKKIGLLWETGLHGCVGPSCQSVFSSFDRTLDVDVGEPVAIVEG
jgi:sialidase-1